MSRIQYANLQAPRDSLELASLASSDAGASHSSRSSSPSGISSSRKLSLSNDDPLAASNPAASRPTPHGRSYSVSSAFDFASNLFPLSSTAAGYSALGDPSSRPVDLNGASLEKHKSLTYLNGLSLIVGLIIGSGIFSSPAQVNINAGSYGASLVVWTVAGILAWTGAASYAELGGAIPLNGGAQVYLSKIFGDWAGFLFTWCAVFVLKPGSAAIISIIFGEYMVRAVVGADAENASAWTNKGVALAGLALVTILNCVSTKLGTSMGDIFMFFKFIALFGITIVGIVVAATGFNWHGTPNNDWRTTGWFEGTSNDLSSWAVALYAGLWAFDGWDNTNYVVGEFIYPHRDLPRVIHTAMPLVILSYLFASVAYIFVLPQDVITSSNTIAVQFGSVVFGRIGSLVLSLIVSASCFGALNATTFTSGRLVYAAGKEGFLPGLLGRIGMPGAGEPINRLQKRSWASRTVARLIGDDDGGFGFTPINAMVFNALLTGAYIVVGEFGTLVTFYGVAGYTFYFLTVLGLIVLRVREPYLERPYKTWISTPIIFCCVSLFLLSRAVFAKPGQTVIVVAFVAAGVPVYFWRVKNRGRKKGEEGNWKFWRRWGRS
jgi:amino acid transporter